MPSIVHRRRSVVMVAAWLYLSCAAAGDGLAAIVIANRAKTPVKFNVASSDDRQQSYTVAPDDIVCLFTSDAANVRFETGRQTDERSLKPDSVWFFHQTESQLHFDEIALPELPIAEEPPPDAAENSASGEPEVITIGVKLLVDEEERAARPRWEERLRTRLQKASAIFERYARVRFNCLAIDVWKSDDHLDELEDALREFESQVDPKPGKVAIGFSSQYEIPQGRVMLGGTHGALRSHILLREWSQHVSEPERLEMLVHELGHFLGAVHSPENDSVMRPMLGDRQAVARQFRIRLDPINTLAVSLVADELRAREVGSLAELRPYARRRLGQIYTLLGQVLPDDPATGTYLALVEPQVAARRPVDERPALPRQAAVSENRRPEPAGLPFQLPAVPPPHAELSDRQRLVESTREVLRALVAAAEENGRLPLGRQAAHEDLYRRDGDRLMEFYASAAADAASYQPTLYQNQSFLLALAIAIDTDHWLRDLPVIGDFLRQIEPEVERAHRLEFIGLPTLRDRHDLAQHFFVAAAIAAMAGRAPAEAAGLAKEFRDADGGSGFSFSDWMADLAGIALADKLAAGEISLRTLARLFRAEEALPPPDGLPDGLQRPEFQERFGSTSDERFKLLDNEVRKRIAASATR